MQKERARTLTLPLLAVLLMAFIALVALSSCGSGPVVVQGGQQQGSAQQEGSQQQGSAQQEGGQQQSGSSSGTTGTSSPNQSVVVQQQAQQQQQAQPDVSKQLQQLIDTLNKNNGPNVVIAGTAPARGQIGLAPNLTYAGTKNEADALQAAIAYYAAAGKGDYATTYSMLDPTVTNPASPAFTRTQWIQANQNLDTASGRYVITGVEEMGNVSTRPIVKVWLTVYLADGTSFDRITSFQLYNGWKKNLTSEEENMFKNALK